MKKRLNSQPMDASRAAILLLAGTTLLSPAGGAFDAEPPPPQATSEAVTGTAPLPDPPSSRRERAVEVAESGQPEFALRLVSGMTVDEDLLSLRRQWYQQALEDRISRRQEGALAELLLNPPPGCESDRAGAATQLSAMWRADTETTPREFARRLRWFEQLQASIQPAPMAPEFPIKMMLLALDSTDPATDPEVRLGMLPIAEQLSPNDPLWSGYYFNDQEMLQAARTLEGKGEYLKAFEIYRQLIYRMRDKASWFQRQLAHAQLERMILLEQVAGVDSALQAGALVRKEFFNQEEGQRFRIYQDDLRTKLAAYRHNRILPQNVTGDLIVESSPVAYQLRDEMYVQKSASVSVGPGAIIQNGRIVLEGGQINLNGTAEYPVKLIDVTIVSDDVSGGGRIAGQYVQFRNCRWVRANPLQSIPWATQLHLTNTYSTNCTWLFDRHVKVQWFDSEFARCDVAYARPVADMPRTGIGRDNDVPDEQAPDSAPSIDALQWAHSESEGFRVCRFIDCYVDDVVAIGMPACSYIDCTLSVMPSASRHAADAMTPVVGNYYEPAGQMAYWINQRVMFDDETSDGPYVFDDAETEGGLNLGKADFWID